MRTSVIFREASSQAARETARAFQTTLHWTRQYFVDLAVNSKRIKQLRWRQSTLGFSSV